MWKSVEKRLAVLNGVERSAANGGKLRQLPLTKGDKKRQVRCRLLPLRFCGTALTSTTVRRWCLVAKPISKPFISSPFSARRERSEWSRQRWRDFRSRSHRRRGGGTVSGKQWCDGERLKGE
jgi:hypothetical protein